MPQRILEYESPNIVIVPTMSFSSKNNCEPPLKKLKMDNSALPTPPLLPQQEIAIDSILIPAQPPLPIQESPVDTIPLPAQPLQYPEIPNQYPEYPVNNGGYNFPSGSAYNHIPQSAPLQYNIHRPNCENFCQCPSCVYPQYLVDGTKYQQNIEFIPYTPPLPQTSISPLLPQGVKPSYLKAPVSISASDQQSYVQSAVPTPSIPPTKESVKEMNPDNEKSMKTNKPLLKKPSWGTNYLESVGGSRKKPAVIKMNLLSKNKPITSKEEDKSGEDGSVHLTPDGKELGRKANYLCKTRYRSVDNTETESNSSYTLSHKSDDKSLDSKLYRSFETEQVKYKMSKYKTNTELSNSTKARTISPTDKPHSSAYQKRLTDLETQIKQTKRHLSLKRDDPDKYKYNYTDYRSVESQIYTSSRSRQLNNNLRSSNRNYYDHKNSKPHDNSEENIDKTKNKTFLNKPAVNTSKDRECEEKNKKRDSSQSTTSSSSDSDSSDGDASHCSKNKKDDRARKQSKQIKKERARRAYKILKQMIKGTIKNKHDVKNPDPEKQMSKLEHDENYQQSGVKSKVNKVKSKSPSESHSSKSKDRTPNSIKSIIKIKSPNKGTYTKEFDLRSKLPFRNLNQYFKNIRSLNGNNSDGSSRSKERENLVITVANDSEPTKCEDEAKKAIQTQKAKKIKQIELVINVICENSQSSASDDDGEKDETVNPALFHEDLSFLDDFNIDDIVDCLSSAISDKDTTTSTNTTDMDISKALDTISLISDDAISNASTVVLEELDPFENCEDHQKAIKQEDCTDFENNITIYEDKRSENTSSHLPIKPIPETTQTTIHLITENQINASPENWKPVKINQEIINETDCDTEQNDLIHECNKNVTPITPLENIKQELSGDTPQEVGNISKQHTQESIVHFNKNVENIQMSTMTVNNNYSLIETNNIKTELINEITVAKSMTSLEDRTDFNTSNMKKETESVHDEQVTMLPVQDSTVINPITDDLTNVSVLKRITGNFNKKTADEDTTSEIKSENARSTPIFADNTVSTIINDSCIKTGITGDINKAAAETKCQSEVKNATSVPWFEDDFNLSTITRNTSKEFGLKMITSDLNKKVTEETKSQSEVQSAISIPSMKDDLDLNTITSHTKKSLMTITGDFNKAAEETKSHSGLKIVISMPSVEDKINLSAISGNTMEAGLENNEQDAGMLPVQENTNLVTITRDSNKKIAEEIRPQSEIKSVNDEQDAYLITATIDSNENTVKQTDLANTIHIQNDTPSSDEMEQESETENTSQVNNKETNDSPKCDTPRLSRNHSPIQSPQVPNAKSDKETFSTVLEQKLMATYKEPFKVITTINWGQYSKVVLCKDSKNKSYAVKYLKPNYHVYNKMVKVREGMMKDIQRDVPKQNLTFVSVISSFNVLDRRCYLMEYYPKNLTQLLHESMDAFHIHYVKCLMRQLVSALIILRDKNILHSDIKPDHILINAANNKLKLCGFDRACYYERHKMVLPYTGTVNYRAPEVILGYTADFGVDIWATALIMFELLTKRTLFPGHYDSNILFKIICTIGYIPDDMIHRSKFGHKHFLGTNWFLKRYGSKKEEFKAIHKNNIIENNILMESLKNTRSLEENDEMWQRGDYPQYQNAKYACYQLLRKMLQIHPKHRLPIQYVYTDPFLFEPVLS